MRSQLESLAETLDLSKHVVFHGFVPQKQCAEFLLGCDALVLPSLYECGGAVVLEAMAMGLPVIATKWGGPAEYLDETSGILIEPSGRGCFIMDLAEAMVRLGRSPEFGHQLGAAGQARVVANFDWEKKTEQILCIYARAVQLEVPRGRRFLNF
jgi:glycosyltransferase involved in cell wall biosynthesis